MEKCTNNFWYQSYPEDVPHEIEGCCYANIGAMFDSVTEAFSKHKAYISLGSAISYGELSDAVNKFAAFLQHELNVQKGEHFAIILPNTIQYPIAVFAALKLGLKVVNINPLYTEREIAGVLADSLTEYVLALDTNAATLAKVMDRTKIKAVILTSVGDMLGPLKGPLVNFAVKYIKKLVPDYPREKFLYFKEILKKRVPYQFKSVDVTLDDIAFLQYTGGTTGKPKGAMLTHKNILSNVAQTYAMYGPAINRGEETLLTALPFYHIFAMTINLMFGFFLGSTSVLILDARDFKSTVKALKQHPELSIITGVNTLYNAMLNYGLFDKVKLKKLRLVVGGGAAVQKGVAERFLATTGLAILEGYGLTECSPLCCVNPYTVHEYNGSIGLPVPSTQARIVDTNTHEEITNLGHAGELQFKGPQVMMGYYRNPEETANVFDDGWLRTGDIAVWQEGGYIKIIDRLKDMILVSGFNVFPSEIEDVISLNPRVLECAVVGVPSKSTGEAIKLIVVKKDPTLNIYELLAYCRQYLTGYKMPKYVEFVDELPKSPVGKVMRRYLRQSPPHAS